MFKRLLLIAGLFLQAQAQSFEPIVTLSSGQTLSSFAIDGQGNFIVAGTQVSAARLWTTKDLGRTWQPVIPGSGASDDAQWVADPEDPFVLYAATGGGGVDFTNDGGKAWYEVYRDQFKSIAISRRDRNVLLATHVAGGLFRSVDGARTWTQILPDLTASRVIADPSGFGIAAAIEMSGGMLLSRDDGATWHSTPIAGSVKDIRFHPQRRGAYYVLAEGKIYLGEDFGLPRLKTQPAPSVASIFPDPQRSGRVWAAANDGLYRSENEGDSWTRIASGAMSAVRGCGPLVVVQGENGAQATINGGLDWELPGLSMQSLVFGANCLGYAQVADSVPFLSKFSPEGKLLWSRIAPFALGPGARIAVLPSGEIVYPLFDVIARLSADGLSPRLLRRASGLPIVHGALTPASDGSLFAFGNYNGSYVGKWDATGRQVFDRPAVALAGIDTQNRAVVVLDDGVFILDDFGEPAEKLLDTVSNTIHFLADGDFLATRVIRGAPSQASTLRVERLRPGLSAPVWSFERLTSQGLQGGIRLMSAPDGRVWVQTNSWLEALFPFGAGIVFDSQLLIGGPSLAALDSDGRLAWSACFSSTHLSAIHNGTIFVTRPNFVDLNLRGDIFRLVPPVPELSAPGIDSVLDARTMLPPQSTIDATLLIRGRRLGPAERVSAEPAGEPVFELGGVRVDVAGAPARILEVRPTELKVVVRGRSTTGFAKIEVNSPNGPVAPVIIVQVVR